jgi:predicted O-methyltransferase YrrM
MKIRRIVKTLWEKAQVRRLGLSAVDQVFTHMTRAEKLKLYKLGSTCRGGTYVEIGSYLGASSGFLAAAAKRRNARLFCVDTWNNDAMSEGPRDTYAAFCRNIERFGGVVTPLRMHSVAAAAKVSPSVDLIFFDGDHSYEGVRADVEAWLPKVKDGALVVFHDVGWAEGVRRVIADSVEPVALRSGSLPNLYWAWITNRRAARTAA